jgi:2-polyprenyl-3-methyl-5-hydroxy-6-metoxy-1,4-benzoquinol methylase
MYAFYDLKQVPVHSVLLHSSRKEAVEFTKGDICLAYCLTCGFISNISFEPGLQNYFTHNYDATQAYSDTFNAFHHNLALRLIDRHDLRGKKIVEIGCGQGEFLDLLCRLGGNVGIGFDPAYAEGRSAGSANDRITFIKEYYNLENSRRFGADFVCCKMTLEHIHEPFKFVDMVSRSVRKRPNTVVFFQVPNARYVLQETAFWDIYYEHCSYFNQNSLNYLFQLCGFQVINNSIEYDGQYLLVEARPAGSIDGPHQLRPNELAELENDISNFQLRCTLALKAWRDRIAQLFSSGKKLVIWGGGSKAVAFLTTIGVQDEIEYAVDINPNKQGTFLAGTGQRVISPEFLISYKPDLIIVMNPIYMGEIRRTLVGMGVPCDLLPVNSIVDNQNHERVT